LGFYLHRQKNCTKFTRSFDTGEASEAHGSEAYNVFSTSSQELSYLFQKSLLQITENPAKLRIALAPNAKLINCGIKQHTKCVQRDSPHNSSNHKSFWKEKKPSLQNYFLLQFSSKKLPLSSTFEHQKVDTKIFSKHKCM